MTRVHTFLLFSSLEGHLQWQIRSPNPALVHSWTESLEAVAKENKTVLCFDILTQRGGHVIGTSMRQQVLYSLNTTRARMKTQATRNTTRNTLEQSHDGCKEVSTKVRTSVYLS